MPKNSQDYPRMIVDKPGIDLALDRLAAEIIKRLGPAEDIAIIGIRRRGVHLGRRLCAKLETLLERPVLYGVLDITLYRDDLTTVSDRPVVRGTSIAFSIDKKSLVLVDDVLYTGRTIQSALEILAKLGRPRRMHLAIMIDRGHRELPIQADFVGKYVETSDDEIVEVRLAEEDGEERVMLVKKQP